MGHKDTIDEVIAGTPHIKDNVDGKATSNLEFDVGIGALFMRTTSSSRHGASVKTSCKHIFSSSVSSTLAMIHGNVPNGQTPAQRAVVPS